MFSGLIAGGRKQHTAESAIEKLVGDRNLAVMTAVAEAIDDSLVGHVVSLVDILGNDGARPLSACRSLGVVGLFDRILRADGLRPTEASKEHAGSTPGLSMIAWPKRHSNQISTS